MRVAFFWFIVALGAALAFDGALGLIVGYMWGFRPGGGGPIPTRGREARILGVFYLLTGGVIIFLAQILDDLM